MKEIMKPTYSKIFLRKSSFENNINFLRNNLIDRATIVSFVVKGNAYGHGIQQMVPLAESFGIRHFSTFSADEAFLVDEASMAGSTVLIMGWIGTEDMKLVVEKELEFQVFEIERLESALLWAKSFGKKARIHLELETGMNRTGLNQQQLEKAVSIIRKNSEYIHLVGISTHLAGAECIANFVRVKNQINTFKKKEEWLQNEGVVPEIRHIASSAACMNYPETQLDLVRSGIILYGLWPSVETKVTYLSKHRERQKADPLERVISWKSEVMSIKNIKQGEFVGYGTSFLASEDITIAVIPVGYSYGYSRSLSNHSRVLIRGERLAVIGVVNMNMLTVDITGYDNIKKGDEVVLIGSQGDLDISVSDFTQFSSQIDYEMLSRLPMNISRHLTD